MELEVEDNVIDAIRLLYEKDVSGAPIADIADPDTTTGRFPDRYVGFIDFARLVLWSLEVSFLTTINQANLGASLTIVAMFCCLRNARRIVCEQEGPVRMRMARGTSLTCLNRILKLHKPRYRTDVAPSGIRNRCELVNNPCLFQDLDNP